MSLCLNPGYWRPSTIPSASRYLGLRIRRGNDVYGLCDWMRGRIGGWLCSLGGQMTPSTVTIDHLAEQMHKYMRRSHALAWALFASLLMLSAALGLVYKLSAERIRHENTYEIQYNSYGPGYSAHVYRTIRVGIKPSPIPLDYPNKPRAVNVPGRIVPFDDRGYACYTGGQCVAILSESEARERRVTHHGPSINADWGKP